MFCQSERGICMIKVKGLRSLSTYAGTRSLSTLTGKEYCQLIVNLKGKVCSLSD